MTTFDTNEAVHPQKMDRSLKFWIKEVEGSYFLCRENKGADQLPGYLPLFMHVQIAGFLMLWII